MILIAIGANLPGRDGTPPLTTCRTAAAALDALPGLRLTALSRWFETAPVPLSDQPNYVNGAARLRGSADPACLLEALQAIEAGAGRERGLADAARTLDLDIIAMGEHGALCRTAPDPILPHPRAHLRGFVLMPLLDVAPDWMHPILRRPISALLAGLPPQDVRPIGDVRAAGIG
jgi:2-amino-4-hydroxy-6-hydroxymethyldihydropteridine diphosphokinase